MSGRRGCSLAATLLLFATWASPSGTEPAIGLVHVEANVGGASGGHTALLLGDRAYHFQLGENGLLALDREDWASFIFQYNVLDNRPLHLARVPVSVDDFRRVRERFDQVYLAQQRAADRLDALRRDAAGLETLLGMRAGVPTRGAGLLDPSLPRPDSARALGRRVEDRLPAGFLDAVGVELEAILAGAPASQGDIEPWRESLALRAALSSLREGHALSPQAAIPVGHSPLSDLERRSLVELAETLESQLADLVRSRRPDRALAVFAALARHRAASQSLETNRLVLVDAFPDSTPTLEGRALAARRPELSAIAELLGKRLDELRAEALAGSAPEERRLATLEALATRVREYQRGAERGEPVRETGEVRVPERGAALGAGVAVGSVDEGLLSLVREQISEGEDQQRARWDYDLFFANCVSALASTLNGALGGVEAASLALGGVVEPDELLAFWPLVFFHKASGRLAVDRVDTIPSHRARQLERLRRNEHAALVYARESNVITSRIYQRRTADGSFLLFTDDIVWVRPLYGAVNLAWSLGDAALGLITWPFDRGDRLLRAGRGALFSLPELAFVNIRKGSFDAATLARSQTFLPR